MKFFVLLLIALFATNGVASLIEGTVIDEGGLIALEPPRGGTKIDDGGLIAAESSKEEALIDEGGLIASKEQSESDPDQYVIKIKDIPRIPFDPLPWRNPHFFRTRIPISVKKHEIKQ